VFDGIGGILDGATLAIGQAGTANEAAAASGVPVVALELAGDRRSGWYRMRQERLLGDALAIVPGESSAAAAAIVALLNDPARRARMSAAGANGWAPAAARPQSRKRSSISCPRRSARMSFADRTVVAAIAFMYVAIPLYGTFEVLDPVRLPIPGLISATGAIGIALAMFLAAAICVWGAFRRPAPRRIVLAQSIAGLAIIPAALLGFDPQTGLELALLVLAMGSVGIAMYGYSALPGATRTIVIATLASATLAALAAWS